MERDAEEHRADEDAKLQEPSKPNKGKKGKHKKEDLKDFDMEKELEEVQADEHPKQQDSARPTKGKKGKGKNDNPDFDMEKELAELEANEQARQQESAKPTKGKKGKGKNDNADFDMEKELNELQADEQPELQEAPKASKGKRAKGKNDNADFDMEKEPDELQDDQPPKQQEPAKSTKSKKGKGKNDNADFDMEKELQELEADEHPKQQVPTKPTKGKKGKGKHDNADFDMEKELADLEEQAKSAAPQPGKKCAQTAELVEKNELTAEEKKKDKKGKAAEKKADAKAAASDAKTDTGTGQEAGDDKGKKKPVNKNVAAMKEQLRRIQEAKEKAEREEDERIRREEEAENQRLAEIQKEKERKEREKQKKKDRVTRQKAEGKFLTPKQKQDQARAQAMLEALKAQGLQLPNAGEKMPRAPRTGGKKVQRQASDDKKEEAPPVEGVESQVSQESLDDEGEKSGSEGTVEDWDHMSTDEENEEPLTREASKATEKRAASPTMELTVAKEDSKQKVGNLRSAVVCVLGHVDTGKTKILDKIRRTNVQDNEAGGITQQIGATMVPEEAIRNQSSMVIDFSAKDIRLPGLLIIDTPGHESFSNLRSRGSSLCDIAILVVDIMHGLEPQTIESLNMLKTRKTPFIVALNKIDRLFNWKTMPNKDVRETIKAQAKNVQQEFDERAKKIVVEFAEQGLNAAVFYENPDPKTFISMVPTSAHSGDGMGNLMAFIVNVCQTLLAKRLTFSEDLQCTVLEVKELTGLGTTVDVILTNGSIREGDTVVLAGIEGPVMTQIRGLLMPQPLKELRVKNPYEKHKIVHGAQGIKILAKDLESCLAGLPLYVANTPEDQEKYKAEISDQLDSALKSIQKADRGVYVQASTLGSLEALLEFLKTSKIPYCGINIGPVHKKDVRNASAMLEHDSGHLAVILAFDVKVEREAQQLADELGVKIYAADIIYHLFDRFTQYQEELKAKKREENKHLAIFPCKLKILPQFVFNTRDPIVVGVTIDAGVLKVGTPLTVPSKEFVDIGIVTGIEINHKPVDIAKKGQEVCIKIDPEPGSTPKLLGRHFELEDVLVSKISRPSIDVCKDYFRDDLTKADWQLMVELKKLLNVF